MWSAPSRRFTRARCCSGSSADTRPAPVEPKGSRGFGVVSTKTAIQELLSDPVLRRRFTDLGPVHGWKGRASRLGELIQLAINGDEIHTIVAAALFAAYWEGHAKGAAVGAHEARVQCAYQVKSTLETLAASAVRALGIPEPEPPV